MPPPPDVSQYILSASESQRIFTEEILTSELTHLQHAGHLKDGVQPIVVLIAGQTGAGKTRLAPDLWDAILTRHTSSSASPSSTTATSTSHPKAAHFIADVYKTYHPAYASILASGRPELASPATGTDARKWLEMAARYAISCRVDTLVESACRYPGDFKTLATAFKEGGYRVCVAVMAVPECLSLMGCLVRYFAAQKEQGGGQGDREGKEEEKLSKMPPRLTPKKVHDDTYLGLEDAAGWIDAGDEVDSVIVVRRNGLMAYENTRSSDDKSGDDPSHTARGALQTERLRPLDTTESASFQHDITFMKEGGYAEGDPKIKVAMEQIETARKKISPATVDEASEGRCDVAFPDLQALDCKEWLAAV